MLVTVLTTGRQDWGILRSTCLALRGRASVVVLAGGMACDTRFGKVEDQIRGEGLTVESIPWSLGPEISIDQESGAALAAIGAVLRRLRPDVLVLAGDRYETAAAALAATVLSIPVVHLHGGEETEGAIDNVLRHAISKLASLHFVSHPTYARRLMQMGEAADTVQVSGAPGLDNLERDDLPSRSELERTLGVALTAPVVIVTVHPSTLSVDPALEARVVAEAMEGVEATYVVTLPNADPGAQAIRELMQKTGTGPRRAVTQALGERGYWGLLRIADAMLGNSSSGLIEAPAVFLPTVNVGDRQAGRLRGANVIDVAANAGLVVQALQRALLPSFREEVRKSPALFGAGGAGNAIAERLLRWTPPKPARKRFVDR